MMEDTHRNAAAVARDLRRFSLERVHLPDGEDYHTRRLPWNRVFDPRPAVIVEAGGPDEVRAAVRAARERELPIAVQSTGHGIVVPSDGGMLLTTSRMASVVVDPAQRTVRVGGGTRWGEVIAATARFGLAPLSGVPMVGVAGYTLGGGAGWLSRKYGFAADSMLRAQVVTAQGQLLTASDRENPDLFWALRGGSGNFGVVTSLELRLYPVERVYTRLTHYPVGRAAQAIACYREWAYTQPDELNTGLVLSRMPTGPQVPEPVRGKPVLSLRTYYVGTGDRAERALAPLLAAIGPPLWDNHHEDTFARVGSAIAGLSQPPQVIEQDVALFQELSDNALAPLLELAGGSATSPFFVDLRHWGGAMARAGAGAGPVGHRQVPFSISFWTLRGRRAQQDRDDLAHLAARLAPHATGGSYLNFLGDAARTESAFTPANYRRLVEVKRKYDPANVFCLNHNIPPGTPGAVSRERGTPPSR